MITVDAGVLAKAMRHAAAVTERRNTIPILSNVLLVATGETLSIVTTDLDLQFSQTVPLRTGGELITTVDSQRLATLAGAVENGAQISLELKDNRLTVKSGRGRWVLPVLPRDDFPVIVAGDFEASIDLPGAALARAIGRVGVAISTEETRYYLNGIFLSPDAGQVRFVATDGHRMMAVTVDAVWPENAPEAIVPRKFARTLEKLAAEFGEGVVSLAWSASKARAEIGPVTLLGKTIDGSFPDYRRVIPSVEDTPVAFDPAVLRGAVRRVALIATEKTRAVKLTRAADRLVLDVTSPDNGTASEELPADCDVSGTGGFECGFNAAYLGDMLEAIGGDTIELHHAAAGAPALFRRKVPDGALGVLMPMRV